LAGELFNLSFIMRKCLNCDNTVPNYIKIDGKKRNLKNTANIDLSGHPYKKL
jgi:hypothetical protein